jgi:hypothetical protein
MPITSKRIQLLRGEPRPVIQSKQPEGDAKIRADGSRPGIIARETTLPEWASPDMTWAAFCDLVAAMNEGDMVAYFQRAEREFSAICRPRNLADVTEDAMTRFAEGLAAEGMEPDAIRRRFSNLRIGIKWGFDVGLIDPSQVPVERRGSKWVFKFSRKWTTVDRRFRPR